MPGTRREKRPTRPHVALAAVVELASSGMLVACGDGGDEGAPTLTWYTNPDSGGKEAPAAKCTEAAAGDYRVEISGLPTDADSQREQVVRRLAANDSSIDLMSLDVVVVPEFAEAGFLRSFDENQPRDLTRDVLGGPVETAMWNDELVAAPFWANTLLQRRIVAGLTAGAVKG